MTTDHIERFAIALAAGDRVTLVIFDVVTVDLYGNQAPTWFRGCLEHDCHAGGANAPAAIEGPRIAGEYQFQFAFQIGLQFLAGDPPAFHSRVHWQQVPKVGLGNAGGRDRYAESKSIRK